MQRNRAFLLGILFFAASLASIAGASLSSRYGHPSPIVAHPYLAATLGAFAVSLLATWVFSKALPWHEENSSSDAEHNKFLAAAESSLDDFYIFEGVADDADNIVDFRFSYINPNAERRLQLSREQLLGKVLTEVRPYMVSSGLIESYREVVRTGHPLTREIFIDDDRIKATWISIQVVRLGRGIAITSRDVTERRRLDDHVIRLAHYDQLTGLANRTLLDDRLQLAMLRADRQHRKVAVFMLDIDNFKTVNDSLGHSGGDALLNAMAKRLLFCVRESDTIARMGGDEFVIVMSDFNTLDDVTRCGLQIVERCAHPLNIDDREIDITVSVGLCIYPDCGHDAAELLKNADAAMYIVKGTGRNGLHVFSHG